MNILVNKVEFEQLKSRDPISLQCKFCNNTFYREKHYIQAEIIKNNGSYSFCSRKCKNQSQTTRKAYKCKQCNKDFTRTCSEAQKVKNHFCSQRCSGIYTSQHRTVFFRRSKLELWLESKLNSIYPSIQFLYNDKSAINSELDIYIPSLRLGFELNGPIHYEPIFGLDKLTHTQRRDKQKIISCYEKNIELAIIDTSSFGYFKEERANQFLEMVTSIINNRLRNNLVPL